MTPEEFVARWQNTTLNERQSYQTHFNDLCRMLNVPHPSGSGTDWRGNVYKFEAGGEAGFADVYLEGHFAIEYKAPHKYKDLNAAYDQLLRYREQLKNLPLLIVTDIEKWQIHTNFEGTEKRVYEFKHQDIASLQNVRDHLEAMFAEPKRLHPHRNTADVTKDAARGFQLIADNMRAWDADPARIARFLTKLVFCLFAEDIHLLPTALNVFRGTEKIATKPAAGDFAPRLDALHQALDKAVCAAYGWDVAILADEEAILSHLLALNLARA